MEDVLARRFLSMRPETVGPGDDSREADGPGECERTESESCEVRCGGDFPGLTERDMGRTRPVRSDLLRFLPPV
jgi:hypothetical protein